MVILRFAPFKNFVSYSALVTFILLVIIKFQIINADAEQLIEKVEVYKCKGSKLNSGHEIPVTSYLFNTRVILRIKDTESFQGCGSLQQNDLEMETELVYLVDLKTIQINETTKLKNEIETSKIIINPNGILNIRNHFYNLDEYCISDHSLGSEVESPSLEIKYCPVNCLDENDKHLCIRKCCSVGQVVHLEYHKEYPKDKEQYSYSCKSSENKKNWTPFFYDQNSWNNRIKENKYLKKVHYFKEVMDSICNRNESHLEPWMMRKPGNSTRPSGPRLLTNGQLIYITDHRQWTLLDKSNQFCIDGMQNFGEQNPFYSGDERDQIIFVCVPKSDYEPDKNMSRLYMYSLLFASAFYLATMIVRLLLWNKQNTHDWAVFCLLVSQCFMCVFVGNAHRLGLYGDKAVRNSKLCVSNAILAHFFILATFTWLTVINYGLWSQFRSLNSPNSKAMNLKRFSKYCIFGWGTPTVVVIVGIILDCIFPDRESLVIVPEYGLNKCYVAPYAQGVYIYYIMAVLLGITMTLSIMACAKIYEYHKSGAEARSSSSAGDRKIFITYARLSVVFGTSWIMEFISWFASSTEHQQHWIWVICDLYNLCTAVFIFFICACNQKNFKELVEKYACLRPINDLIVNWKSKRLSQNSGSTTSTRFTLSARSSRDATGEEQRTTRF